MRAAGLARGSSQCIRALESGVLNAFRQASKKSLASVTFFNEEILTVAGNVACFGTLRFKSEVFEVNVLWRNESEVRSVARFGLAGYRNPVLNRYCLRTFQYDPEA